MPSSRVLASALAVLGLAVPAVVAAAVPAAGAAPAKYSVQTLHFLVHTGPNGSQPCDIIGDLYQPAKASSRHRVPAILTTNGFGGSKADQAGLGKAFASRGYEVLSYSGLGFGGSGCKITLDDPDYDGKAASQLVSYLGGAPGIAFTTAAHTTAAPRLNVVIHDARDHAGHKQKYDPRVGMIGGSYGGEVQFAAADVDPRVDTIVPFITWNDLSYSLGPNNTSQTTGVSTSTPGVTKLTWGVLFSADGVVDGVQGAQGDPSRVVGCPNFATFVCPALATAGTTGYFQPDAIAAFRHASVATYMRRIRIPVLLLQGENDTLFNLNEAAATYRSLRAQGTPVKMIWQSWGHSGATPAPGELNLSDPNPATQYETARVAAWFAHYLGGSKVSTGPNFAYFRDWVNYRGIATPAYANSSTFPVGRARTLYLSGASHLEWKKSMATTSTQSFVAPPVPASTQPVDAVGSMLPPVTPTDAPGTYASWTASPARTALDVVGSPVATLQVQAPVAQASQSAGPAGELVLFVKIEDVAPNGTVTTIHGLEAPVRVPNVGKPFRVVLPGIVHRFAVGHMVRLVVAGSSDNYRGDLMAQPVTITSGPGQTLALPVVG